MADVAEESESEREERLDKRLEDHRPWLSREITYSEKQQDVLDILGFVEMLESDVDDITELWQLKSTIEYVDEALPYICAFCESLIEHEDATVRDTAAELLGIIRAAVEPRLVRAVDMAETDEILERGPEAGLKSWQEFSTYFARRWANRMEVLATKLFITFIRRPRQERLLDANQPIYFSQRRTHEVLARMKKSVGKSWTYTDLSDTLEMGKSTVRKCLHELRDRGLCQMRAVGGWTLTVKGLAISLPDSKGSEYE